MSMPTGHQAMQRPQPTQPAGVELIPPGAELVGHPLPVARASCRPNAAAVDVGMVEREARVPGAPAFGSLRGEVGDVLDRRAEARRAHHRAVAACEASFGYLVPARMLERVLQQLAQAVCLQMSAHASCRTLDDAEPGRSLSSPPPGGAGCPRAPLLHGRCRPGRESGAHPRAARSGPDRSPPRRRARCPSRHRSRCRPDRRNRP